MKYKYNGQWYDVSIKALDSMPIGSIILFAGETIPTGWLICDGDTLNEEEYPELFDVIRYKYGGSGLDFNLPNFKGRVGVGLDSTQTEFDTLGETGGYKGLQKHTHQTIELGGNTMTSWSSSGSGGIFDLSTLFKSNQFNNNQVNTGDVNGAATVNGAPSTSTAGNLQPYLVVNYIIKATNTTPTMASVVNAHSTSTTDTYSCDYVNEINTYSTDEMVVGTWFGKPLYRMIVYGTIAGTGYWEDINMNLPSNIVIRKMDGIMDGYLAIPCNLNGTNRVNLQYQGSSNHVQVLMGGYSNATCVVSVEYTKTTD